MDNEYEEVFGSTQNLKLFKEKIEIEVMVKVKGKKCKHANSIVHGSSKLCNDCGMIRCSHENKIERDNVIVCQDCGIEERTYDFEPEWRYYGHSDNRCSSDPSRCHRSRPNKNLDKLFGSLKINIPEAVRAQTEKKYKIVVGEKTVRGKGRRSIIAACLFHVYREFGDFRTHDEIRDIFCLTKKNLSSGLTEYKKKFPEDRSVVIKPENLIRHLMARAGVHISHYRKVVHLARYLENSSRTLNRSSPQSVASAILYLYICITPNLRESIGMSKSEYATKVKLSDITVTKLVKEAASIVGCIVKV